MKIVLDAIIPRDDFEVEAEPQANHGTPISTLSVQNLKRNDFFLANIRKPDFQRETNEWDAKKILGLITSFTSGDLIPSVILWQSPKGNTFVIDGAHRLSALAAWINDDYGDGVISKTFFNGIIPDDQIKSAERARKEINKHLGSFYDHELAMVHPEKVKPEIAARAKGLGTKAIQVQWVTGDASKAEDSFFKINQEAAPINKTELRLLKSRKKPNGIAARAISRSGTGHKYWSSFTESNQQRVEELSKEINRMLFTPPLKSPIKSLDHLPIGGKLYSQQTLSLILEFTNISNSIENENSITNDEDGDQTVQILAKCSAIAKRINSTHTSSLGLHPAVYFYSAEGKYKPSSFYATTSFVKYLSQSPKRLREFTQVRESFETILIEHEYITEQIIRKWRGAIAGYPHVVNYYQLLVSLLHEGKQPSEIIQGLATRADYNYITTPTNIESQGKEFSREAKSQVFLQEALTAALRCKICNALIHVNSITIDHVIRKRDGGTGAVTNGQLAHPYCNSTYKN